MEKFANFAKAQSKADPDHVDLEELPGESLNAQDVLDMEIMPEDYDLFTERCHKLFTNPKAIKAAEKEWRGLTYNGESPLTSHLALFQKHGRQVNPKMPYDNLAPTFIGGIKDD